MGRFSASAEAAGETTDLFLLLLCGFNLQLFIQFLPHLLQLVLGVWSERTPEFGAHYIDELEEGGDEFPGVLDLRIGGDREFDDDVLLAFLRV